MSKIHSLPEHLIDQIKAGEVVERPASMIKELLENSIDAGAQNINIHIVDNALTLFSLKDDGHGMAKEDLPLAFSRHATSKIDKFDDLYTLNTFGFRGEALASISAISKLTCQSSTKKNGGGRISIDGGKVISLTDMSDEEHGTHFIIKDLFYNTPARLKFLKGKSSEKKQIRKLLGAFILANPHVNFTIRFDQDKKEFYAASSNEIKDVSKRASILFKTKSTLLNTEKTYDGITLKVIVDPSSSKSIQSKLQYLVVNKRFFIDRSLHAICTKSMAPLWPPTTQGHYYLEFSLAPHLVDVNVHPSKTFIKFFKPEVLYSLLKGTLKELVEKNNELIKPTEIPKEEITRPQSFIPLGETKTGMKKHLHAHNTKWQLLDISYNSFGIFKNVELDQVVLIHLAEFTKAFIEKIIFGNEIIDETEITPMLIAEPINSPLPEQNVLKLSNYGFSIERLPDDLYLIQSCPKKIDFINAQFLKQIVLDFDAINFLEIKSLILEHEWIKILELVEANSLMTTNLCKFLSKENLEQSFSSSLATI